MKAKNDLVQGWLQKAESDLANAKMCIASNQALDTACFHAQQAAERCIKAYLTPYAVELRYDNEFWPSVETAHQALDSALTIQAFVTERLSSEMEPKEEGSSDEEANTFGDSS